MNASIISAISSGVYTAVVYFLLTKFNSAKHVVSRSNEWIAFILLIYTVGFVKHEVVYYLTIESSYCKQTGVCDEIRKDTAKKSTIEIIKNYLGFAGNVWFEAFGEGIVFVFVGVPVFLIVPPEYRIFAAFITGILADLVSEYSDFHKYFCRNSCNILPLHFASHY